MKLQNEAYFPHAIISEECIICGKKISIDYGYFVSWTLAEWGMSDEIEGRFFCSLDCMHRWLDEIARTGIE